MQQAYRATGLDSESEAEDQGVHEHHAKHAQQQQQSGAAARIQGQPNTQHASSGNPFDSLMRSKQNNSTAQQQQQAINRDGMVTSQPAHCSDAEQSGTAADASTEGQRAMPMVPFDYTAARAKAPGLEMSLGPAETGGRQGGRGRSRGRGRDGGEGARGGRSQGRGMLLLSFNRVH